jgi:ATP-binding cassette subfamily A (ABC1) protein 3
MQLDLFVKTKAGKLSGGNKRKLCVADALIGGSDLAFFDEPSTGVDPVARRFLFNTLKNNVSLRKASVLMTTHTIEEAEMLCNRIA